jgi:hypothetical protein
MWHIREVQIRLMYECRCDERLNTKVDESTRLAHTGLVGEPTDFVFIMNRENESSELQRRLCKEGFR